MIITLTTDFGGGSPYVGSMKGAILSVNPEALVVDVTHDVQPFNVLDGALALKSAYRFFPPRSVHVAVVDPGVGGDRRGLVVVTERHLFVGPDNGVLSLVFDDFETFTCRELNAPHYYRKDISATFHGRDIFGPVAGWLTKGIAPQHFGEIVTDPVRLKLPQPVAGPERITGEVILVDRFGNCVTNLSARRIAGLGGPGTLSCFLGGEGEPLTLVTAYGSVPPGEPCALIGGSGFLEVAVNRGNAAQRFQATPGTPVVVARG